MPPEFAVAPAVTSDAAGLIALRTAIVGEGEYLVAESGETAMPIDMMIARVRGHSVASPDTRTARCMFVARARHQVIGMVEVVPGGFRRNRHVGYLEIMVRADWRGKGVGRALMERVMAWASQSDVRKLALSVYAHNTPAIGLYRTFGFVEEGRRVGEYQFPDGSFRDDLIMARWLGGAP